MNRLFKSILLLVALCVVSLPAQSQFRIYGGKYDKPDKWFAGAGYRIGILPIIDIIPNYEYVFVNSGHFSSLSVVGTIGLLVVGYVGAGIGTNFAKGSEGDTKTRGVVNLLAGVELKAVPLSPFAQVKYVLISSDTDVWMIGVGIHF
jgi:hypothetical protein